MKYTVLSTLLCIFLTAQVKGQSDRDFQSWSGINLSTKINKKWNFQYKTQVRLVENSATFGSFVNQVAFNRKLSKHFNLKPAIRYTLKPGRHVLRTSLDFGFKTKTKNKKLRFKNRIRFQYASPADTFQPKMWLREKVSFSFNLSKLVDPFISGELFFRFKKNEFRVWRTTIGLDWNLPKRFTITTFYRLEQEFNVSLPEQNHIVGVNLGYDFKKKKRAASN